MVKRLRDLNASIRKRVTFDRDETLAALDEGITEQEENLVQTPTNDISIRRISQDYDREEADRQFVRRKLAEMQNQTKRINFGQAFKNARSAGKKTFWWRGKQYTTKLGTNNTKTAASNNKNNQNNTNNKSVNITNTPNKTNTVNKTVKQNNTRNRNIVNIQKNNNISNFSSEELELIRRAEENKRRYNLVQKTPSKYRQINGGYSAVGGAMRIK